MLHKAKDKHAICLFFLIFIYIIDKYFYDSQPQKPKQFSEMLISFCAFSWMQGSDPSIPQQKK